MGIRAEVYFTPNGFGAETRELHCFKPALRAVVTSFEMPMSTRKLLGYLTVEPYRASVLFFAKEYSMIGGGFWALCICGRLYASSKDLTTRVQLHCQRVTR